MKGETIMNHIEYIKKVKANYLKQWEKETKKNPTNDVENYAKESFKLGMMYAFNQLIFNLEHKGDDFFDD